MSICITLIGNWIKTVEITSETNQITLIFEMGVGQDLSRSPLEKASELIVSGYLSFSSGFSLQGVTSNTVFKKGGMGRMLNTAVFVMNELLVSLHGSYPQSGIGHLLIFILYCSKEMLGTKCRR